MAAALESAAEKASRALTGSPLAVSVFIGKHAEGAPCWKRMTPEEQAAATRDAGIVFKVTLVHVDNAKPAAHCRGCELACPQEARGGAA